MTIVKLKRFFDHESAAATTEYALMLAIVGGGLLFGVLALGNESGTFFGSTANSINRIND
jgi:Flp pilus assembly pilin Flp